MSTMTNDAAPRYTDADRAALAEWFRGVAALAARLDDADAERLLDLAERARDLEPDDALELIESEIGAPVLVRS